MNSQKYKIKILIQKNKKTLICPQRLFFNPLAKWIKLYL